MKRAMLFNIQRFSLHDGPGIRTTVFFKGCPLKCAWCHNPESQALGQEMLYDRDQCGLCGMCARVCPQGAISDANNSMVTDLEKCDFCGECVIHCIPGAREIAGREYTVSEVVGEVLKDRVFYEESQGGVTLSGGEPLLEIDFAADFLRKLKEAGIHTAVDTCGAIPWAYLERVAPSTDLFLYDLKLIDDARHVEFIGASNQEIIANLRELTAIHPGVILRIPIIEGVNAEVAFVEETIKCIRNMNIKEVHLLPYHAIATHKYKKLGRDYAGEEMQVPTKAKMDQLRAVFARHGFDVKKEDD